MIEGEPESLNHKYEELSNHEALQVDLELKAAPAKADAVSGACQRFAARNRRHTARNQKT